MTYTNIIAPGFSPGLHLKMQKPESTAYVEAALARRLASIEIRATPAEQQKLYQNRVLGSLVL